MRSFFSMCSGAGGDEGVDARRAAPFSASAARAMSRSLARASEQTVESLMASAMAFTASKSPLLDAAKPASMTSTRRRSELARDAQLLVARHRRAGRLLAVAQRGVEDDELVGHGVALANVARAQLAAVEWRDRKQLRRMRMQTARCCALAGR
jgi:hypothetical protein